MNVHKLLKLLEGKEDFDIEFVEGKSDGSEWGFTTVRSDIEIADIGYSEKTITLTKKGE